MTAPTKQHDSGANSQTSERERLAEWLEALAELGDMGRKPDAKDKHRIAAAQLRADEAEIAQLRAAAAQQTDGRTKLAEVLSQLAEIEQLKAELAALRAENEALRTVTEEDAIRVLSHTGGTPDAARKALQSFIRSKESRRG